MLSDSLNICQSLYAVVGAYPKRVALLEHVQKEVMNEQQSDDYNILRLKSLSMTRWTTRAKAASVVLTKTEELKTALGILHSDKSVTAETRAKTKGILQQLSSVKKMFGLQATYELIGLLENQSTQLQSVGPTADVAKFCCSPVSSRLAEMRTDAEFDRILALRTRAMPGLEEEPDAPASPKRAKKIPRRFEGADVVATERLTFGGCTHVGDQDNSLKRRYLRSC